jgi:hypothetical protein
MNRTIAFTFVLMILAPAAAARAADAPAVSRGEGVSPASPTTQPYRGAHADAIARGVQFLIKSQQPDGFWGTGLETRGLEIVAEVPGSHDAFRVGTSALCVMALREAIEAGIGGAEAKKAHDNGAEYLIRHGEARRDNSYLLYNVWAHTYALQAVSDEQRHGNKDPRLPSAARQQLDKLNRYTVYTGGWNYYDFDAGTQHPSMGATSFGTAAGLVALWEAKQAGVDVPQEIIDRALNRLKECRQPNGTYLYGADYKYIPTLPANRPRGAVGRTQPCNYALWLWGAPKIGQAEAIAGLDLFFAEHAFLEMGRKRPWPHEAWYQTSGYYYYFDHYYAARLIGMLPAEKQAEYFPKLAEAVAPHQEPDGSWWDYAMWDYHKPYGTAFAVMTLLRCDRAPGVATTRPGVAK